MESFLNPLHVPQGLFVKWDQIQLLDQDSALLDIIVRQTLRILSLLSLEPIQGHQELFHPRFANQERIQTRTNLHHARCVRMGFNAY